MPIDRRGVLALLGSGSAIALPGVASAQNTPQSVTFTHGVASGDPSGDGAIIWTRATAEEGYTGDIALTWHIAQSATGDSISTGKVLATGLADHTAKVDVGGLRSGMKYYYWFSAADGTMSPKGRFRTLPVGAVDRLTLAVTSCQLYPGGYFNAFADMAKLEELDAVIQLGDYIYEYGADGYGVQIGTQLDRLPDPPHETVTLADYRRRHAQVKADPDMQAAHARAAFICVWDDHEITNDGWHSGAQNHQSETEGDWAARKAVAMQAYFEWMPIRDPDPLRAHEAIFRSFEFGDLATLAMLETRLLARDQQALPKGDAPAEESIAGILAERGQLERELLGRGQSEWLRGVLSASVDADKTWQIIGNQVIMARVAGPDLEEILGADGFATMREGLPVWARNQVDRSMISYRAGVPFNLDGWDGYPHARERLYRLFAETGTRPLVCSGDSHAAWSNNLHDDTGRLAAIEVGCTAATSPSYGSVFPGLGRLLSMVNDEVAFCDQDQKGYSLLTLTPNEARAAHVAISTVTERNFSRAVLVEHRAASGMDGGPFRKV